MQLIRQYLSATLKVYSYFSVATDLADPPLVVYQLLSFERKPVLVSVGESGPAAMEPGLFEVSVQPLEIWNPLAKSFIGGPPHEIETFTMEDPCVKDVLALLGDSMLDIGAWRTWSWRPSDVEGCVALHAPRPLQAQQRLSDKAVPVLSLLQFLRDAGFNGVSAKVVHRAGDGARVFDRRRVVSKRAYLQCVISRDELAIAGVNEFSSVAPQAFYELLLRSKTPIPEGLSAKEYRRRLALMDGDQVALASLDRETVLASAPAPRQPQAAKRARDWSVAGSSSSERAVGGAGDADEGSSSSSSSSGSSSDSSGSTPAAVAGGEEENDGFPLTIGGQTLQRVKGRHDHKWSYCDRLALSCNNLEHPRCTRGRSIALGTTEFGRLAPIYYLGAWLRMSHLSADAHKRYRPDAEAMREFAASWPP